MPYSSIDSLSPLVVFHHHHFIKLSVGKCVCNCYARAESHALQHDETELKMLLNERLDLSFYDEEWKDWDYR